jgi:Rieske Fe-S protein
MPQNACLCAASGSDHSGDARDSGAERGLAVPRRNVLAAGAAALTLLFLDRLPGAQPSIALARMVTRFRAPSGSHIVSSLKRLRANSAVAVTDPRTGNPAVVIRASGGKSVKAFSAVCTHAGCTVHYDSGQKVLVCPCHGSVFDPAHGAAVLAGPAPAPLPSLKVAVDPKGNIWLV